MVAIINKQTSKEKQVMFIVRSLVLVVLQNNIYMTARHIPGVHNVLNDAISRYQVSEDMLLQYGMKKTPVTIPQQLLPQNFNLSWRNF